MAADWTSYDSAASAHDRLRVPAMFAAPARDLAGRMELRTAQSVLDVGTGSGVVAGAAAGCPMVVGVDPSFKMARIARQNGVTLTAVAGAPGLPFADNVFDRVTAGFVVSHVPSYEATLGDMARVLRPGGLLGATAWGDLDNEYRDAWDAAAERFVGHDELRAARQKALPWEEWLAHEGKLAAALEGAGLRGVTVERVAYPIPMTLATYLEMRETSTAARFLRTRLDGDGWERFREAAARELHARFRDPIDLARTAWIAVGRK